MLSLSRMSGEGRRDTFDSEADEPPKAVPLEEETDRHHRQSDRSPWRQFDRVVFTPPCMPIWSSRALAIPPALVPCSRCRRLRYRRLGSTRGSARDCRGSEIRGCSLSRGRSSSSTSTRRRASFPLRYVARRASLCKVEVESILKRRIEASVQAVMAGLSSSRHLENSSSISQFPQP